MEAVLRKTKTTSNGDQYAKEKLCNCKHNCINVMVVKIKQLIKFKKLFGNDLSLVLTFNITYIDSRLFK